MSSMTGWPYDGGIYFFRRTFRSSRILDDLKKVALQMEADSKKYLEIRDKTKDKVRHEYWRAMAINNHETARMLMAFIDKYIYY